MLLAASRKEKVEDRVAVAEMCGLKPVVMDVDSYAARQALDPGRARLHNGGQGEVIALFDIGARSRHVTMS